MRQGALFMALAGAMAFAAPGLALADNDGHGGHGGGDNSHLTLQSTRDMAFGRITSDGSGSLLLPAVSAPMVTPSGGVHVVHGGVVSSARFVVDGDHHAPDGTIVVVTLPQTFQINAGSQTLIAEDIEASLDGVGQNWTELSPGRYLCTLASGGRCIFVVGARLTVPDLNHAANGLGSFLVRVAELHGDDDDDDEDDDDEDEDDDDEDDDDEDDGH